MSGARCAILALAVLASLGLGVMLAVAVDAWPALKNPTAIAPGTRYTAGAATLGGMIGRVASDAAATGRPAWPTRWANAIAAQPITATPWPSPVATATPLPTPIPLVILDPVAALPPSASISGLIGRPQTLPLSCEARSAADWAAFFGAVVDELEFLSGLPVSDDPDRGFVGDVYGRWGQIPPFAYGVHAQPVAHRLRDYGLAAVARRNMRWEELQAEIAAGRPAIVWVTGHVEDGYSILYTAADGRQTFVAPFEHTVILAGYTPDLVIVLDGAQQYTRPLDVFLRSWQALYNMAVIVEP